MKRRDLLAAVCGAAGALIARPTQLGAQQTGKLPRIGYLVTGSRNPLVTRQGIDAFRQGLREQGYAEGENIVIVDRSADGNIERFPAVAAELVRLKVDVIVAANTPAALAAHQATTMIPIVVSVMGDPVADGLVAGLAKPGGNVTDLTFLGPELVPKRIELLKEALPGISRVAVLWHPGGYGERTRRRGGQSSGERPQSVAGWLPNFAKGRLAACIYQVTD